MTTMGNIPTLAELRARKAASTQTAGGLPTLAELRARKARGDSDPVAQALAKIRAETAAGVPPMGPMGTITPGEGPVVQTVGDMADADYLARNPTTGGAVGEFARGLVNAPMATAKGIAGLVGDPIARAGIVAGVLPQQVGAEIDRNQQAYGTTQNARGLGGALGSGVGQVLTGGGIAKGLGMVAGAGTLAAQGAEAGYQDYRESVGPQEASTLKALAVGGGYGLAEYVGERFGLGALLKAGNAQGFRAGLKAVLQSAGVNASEEFVTQVAQNAISQRYDPSRELTQGAGTAGLVGAFAGGVGAAAMRGVRGGASQGQESRPLSPDPAREQTSGTPTVPPQSMPERSPAPMREAPTGQGPLGPVADPSLQRESAGAPSQAQTLGDRPSPTLGSSRLNIPEGVVEPRDSKATDALNQRKGPQSDAQGNGPEYGFGRPTGEDRPASPAESRPSDATLQTRPDSGQSESPQTTIAETDALPSPNPTPESGRVNPNLPAWVENDMISQGKNPRRLLNDEDVRRPQTAKQLANDPLTKHYDSVGNKAMADRMRRGDLSADEYRAGYAEMKAAQSGRVGPPPGDVAEPKKPKDVVQRAAETPNATTKYGFGGFRDGYKISTPDGAFVMGNVAGVDFPGGKSEPTRGEIFSIEVPAKARRSGTGTKLIEDAVQLIAANGGETIKLTVPNKKFGQPFVRKLIERGVLGEVVSTDERTGTLEVRVPKKSATPVVAETRPEKSPPATPKVAETDAAKTPPKRPANDPQAAAETPTDPPKADAEAAQQILDDGGGISDVADQLGLTIPEAVEIVDKPKKKDRKPAPWSKTDLSDRIRREYENGPYAAVDADTVRAAEDVNAFEGSGMLRFKGKAPADLLEAIEGRPELRRRITENAGSSSMGDDYLSELGTDGYVQMLESQGGRSRAQMVEAIRNDKQNPQGRFLADLSEHTGKSPAKVELADADRVPGTKFKINGNDAEIVEGRYGLDMVVEEMGTYPIDAIESIPADRGSIQRGGVLARAEAALERTATRAKKRLAETKSIKRGRSTGSAINPWTAGADVAVYLSSKIAKAGVRGVRATLGQVRAAMDRFIGFGRYTDEQAASVLKDTNRLVVRSRNKFGGYDLAKLELLHNDLYESVSTEPAKDKDTPRRVQTAADAAVAIERQGAAMREGMATAKGKRKLSELAEAERTKRQEMREAFIDRIEQGKNTRAELARIAREELRPEDRAKVLTHIAKGETEGDLVKGIRRILDVQKSSADRRALKELRKTVGRASAPKDEDATIAKEMLKELNASLGVTKPADPYRDGKVRPADVKKLRTEYRDALAPIVDATRNGNATGANNLAGFIQGKIDDGRSNAFDAEGLSLLQSTEGKALDELNAEQLRVLNDAIQHVAFLSDNENKMQFLGERRDLEEVRKEARLDVRERWGTKEAINPGKSEALGSAAGVAQFAKDLLVTDQDTLSTMVGTVAGRDSIAHKVLYENVVKGQSDQIRFRRELLKDAQLDKWSPADIANANKPRELKYSGGKIKLTGAEMMDIVGLWNDPDSRIEIEKAGLVLEADKGTIDRKFFLNEADVSAIEMAMTPKERAAVPVLQRALKKGYTAANDAHEKMNGFRLPDSDKHWSRRRDISATEREISGEMGDAAQRHRWIEDAGIFKDRSTTKAAVIVRNAIDWVPQQLDTLAGMAHLAIPMREARRVMASPEVKTEFARKGGDNWVRSFENRLAEAVGGSAGDPSNANKIGQRVLGFLARNRLAWRPSTVAKQKLGFLQAAASVADAGHKARIMAQAANAKNYSPSVRAKLREEIDARSGYLAERADPAMSAMLASAANPQLRVAMSKFGRAWQATERVGLSGLQMADADVVFGTYVATKQYLTKTKGLTGDALKDAAVWETEKIIRDSQNPTSVLDMSGLNIQGRKNAGIGMFTMFTSSANKVRNQLRQAASDFAADRSKANAARLASTAMLSVGNTVASRAIGLALSGATVSAIVAAFSGADLDEREITLYGEAVESVAELADTFVPYGFAGDVVRKIGGRPTYSSIPGGVANFMNRIGTAVEAIKEDGMDAQTVRKILKAARASQALPDFPIDVAEKITRGIVGDE